MTTPPFANYRALLARLDEHSARVTARHRAAIACRRGCTACCRQDLHVSLVEAEHILEWLSEHTTPPADPTPTPEDAHPLFAALQRGAPCAFLGPEGACNIYEVRPVICRTHGLPILAEGWLDVCPLNFQGEEVPAPDALRLDLVNQQLALINALYAQQTGGDPSARAPLSALAQG